MTGAGISGGTIDLVTGDMLFIVETPESLVNAAAGAPAGWANSIATTTGNIYAFRAENAGDYSSGFFRLVMNDPAVNESRGITLVESDTYIGDTWVNAGDFLYAQTGNIQKNQIFWYDTSANASFLLIDGADIGISGSGGSSRVIRGIELIETSTIVSGVPLNSGNILLTADDENEQVGNNNLSVKQQDVFILNITATTLGSGTTLATASMLFDGDDVSFEDTNEHLDALTLFVRGSGTNQAPVLGTSDAAASYIENNPHVIVDGSITLSDADSTDFNGGILSVSLSAGGATGDRLSIFNQGGGAGQIGVSGDDVTFGGVIIGSFSGGLNSADPLVINLNANANVAATQTLLRNITFGNVSDNPSMLARTVSYVLNDGDGGTSNVISQTVNVTAVADAPVAVNDYSGLDFDGIDDYVAIADSASLTMTSTMTMEAWIKADASANVNRMMINKEGEYEVALFSDGTLNWAFANTDPGWTWHNTGYVVADGEWTHIAVAYDNGVVSTYVNGTLVDLYNGSGPIGDAHATFDELRIGGRSNIPADKYFDGQIDEVRIWNTARTQGQIVAAMDQVLGGAEAGLAGYWNFNEGSGSNVADLTGNGNTGTLTDGGAGTAGPQWTGYSTDQNAQINIAVANGVLANDLDGDGDALIVTQVNGNVTYVGSEITLPVSGAKLTLQSTGDFVYDPNGAFDYLDAGQIDTDSFTYQVEDGNGGTDTATVTIRITGTADAPVTSNVSTSGDEDATSISITLTGSDVDGDVDYFQLNSLPANGTLYTDATLLTVAAISTDYAATAEALTFYFVPDLNWYGIASFQFVAKDNSGLLDATPATATITVNAVNDDVLVSGAVSGGAVIEDGTAQALGTVDFTDVDLTDDHLVSEVLKSTNYGTSMGSFSVVETTDTTGTGTGGVVSWTYDIDNAAAQQLAMGQVVTEVYTITIDDQNGDTVSQDITITITGTNDAPVISGGPDTDNLTETNAALISSGMLTVGDVDTTDQVTAAVDSLAISGTSNRADAAAPSDAALLAMFSVAPTAILDGIENSDTLSWTFNSGSEEFNYLAVGETLILEYTVKASDDDGTPLNDTETVTITITGSNDAPTATNLNTADAYTEDTLLDLTDIVTGDLDTDTVTVTLTLSDVAAGELSIGTSGLVTSTFAGGVWTASGAIADVNTLLVGVTIYTGTELQQQFHHHHQCR